MSQLYYILDEKGIKETSFDEVLHADRNPELLYLVDLQVDDRKVLPSILKELNIHPSILKKMITPNENIRFNYFGDTLYGEIAKFSIATRTSTYSGVIIHKNLLIGIHQDEVTFWNDLENLIQNLSLKENNKISPEGLLFSMMFEILSNYGKLILQFREKIEQFARHLDDNKMLTPQNLLTSKSQLSDFSRVLERIFYTLSFPPSKDVLDLKSSYRESFDYLLRITTLLNTSIQQTEDRLESLNDHYQLLLHNKANKRLNLLTIVQAIFVPLTLLVGVYGMNFKYMPELEFKNGYYISLGAMFLFILISLFFFYKKGWFKD